MPPPIPPIERARKNEAVILQSLAAAGQSTVALAMGVNESTVSRMKGGDIAHAAALLAHCGLKVVPVTAQCFDPDYVDALRELAKHGVAHGPKQLDWSDTQ